MNELQKSTGNKNLPIAVLLLCSIFRAEDALVAINQQTEE